MSGYCHLLLVVVVVVVIAVINVVVSGSTVFTYRSCDTAVEFSEGHRKAGNSSCGASVDRILVSALRRYAMAK